ncbi:MAG: HAMP domain-containing histidine kinase [Spirosomaceae bacterium]|nr:HAMP domain-containing histidine kinase [Spirosomataceae bacterium]
MTIKSKISFYISTVFTLLFGVVCLFIITLFADFRKQEFEARLNEKALTAVKLLLDVKEVDERLLKIIDQNTINKLYNEKTLIFDGKQNLIYSSLDDTKINWKSSDLEDLRQNKTFFKQDNKNEIYGLFYDSNAEDYFVIISADDNYGKRKLNYLIYILLGAFVLFIFGAWFFTFSIIKKQFVPLDIFHRKIRNINDLNSEGKLEANVAGKNEIDLLSNEFNHMMNRISDVYQKQREFTAQASHELRTPLARILAQAENQLQNAAGKELEFLKMLITNVSQLKELINSLLILSRIDNYKETKGEICRIDEAIYNCIEQVNTQYPNLKVNFYINDDAGNLEGVLEVNGNQNLLEVAFSNLIKNAYLYSDKKAIDIEINNPGGRLIVNFSNTGTPLSAEEIRQLFEPFKRGKNAINLNGLGLGLRIVQRILHTFRFNIAYKYDSGKHIFTVFD